MWLFQDTAEESCPDAWKKSAERKAHPRKVAIGRWRGNASSVPDCWLKIGFYNQLTEENPASWIDGVFTIQ